MAKPNITVILHCSFHTGKEEYSPGTVVKLEKQQAEELVELGYASYPVIAPDDNEKTTKGKPAAKQQAAEQQVSEHHTSYFFTHRLHSASCVDPNSTKEFFYV